MNRLVKFLNQLNPLRRTDFLESGRGMRGDFEVNEELGKVWLSKGVHRG